MQSSTAWSEADVAGTSQTGRLQLGTLPLIFINVKKTSVEV